MRVRALGAVVLACLASAVAALPAVAAAAEPAPADAAAVAAAPAPAPTHTGSPGVHALLEGPENRAVTCIHRRPGGELERVRIEPPVVLAQDRSPGTDAAIVGWRWDLMGDTGAGWTVVRAGPLVKRRATDGRAADLRRASVTLASAPLAGYRVRHRLIWYAPGSRTRKVATSVHWATRYRTPDGDLPPATDRCEPTSPATEPVETPTDHLGRYGPHAIVDTEEHPGLRCTYGGPVTALTHIRIGPAVAFARDLGSGVDRATVTRRLVLQATDIPAAGSWRDVTVLGVERGSATDRRLVAFPGRTIALGTSGTSHHQWRIVVLFRFLDADGHELGRVLEEPLWALHELGPGVTSPLGACYGQD